ncbi:MAG: hypothetical protein ACXWML_09825 [Candidatus Binataceae bacterium]
MGISRNFKPVSIPGEGRHRRGVRVTCCKCPTTEQIAVNSMRANLDNGTERYAQLARRKIEDAGWIVGHNEKHDLCPKCKPPAAPRSPDPTLVFKKEATKMQTPIQPAPKPATTMQAAFAVAADSKAPAPRELHYKDALAISVKLNEVYLDRTKGYGDGYTDAKVAAELNVPRDWVKKVRTEIYGDGAAGNDEIEDALAACRQLLADCQPLLEMADRVTAAADRLEQEARTVTTTTKGLRDRADHIERKLLGIEKALR